MICHLQHIQGSLCVQWARMVIAHNFLWIGVCGQRKIHVPVPAVMVICAPGRNNCRQRTNITDTVGCPFCRHVYVIQENVWYRIMSYNLRITFLECSSTVIPSSVSGMRVGSHNLYVIIPTTAVCSYRETWHTILAVYRICVDMSWECSNYIRWF